MEGLGTVVGITFKFAGIFLVGNLRFTPIAPCRVLDKRGGGFSGPFGQPSLTGGVHAHFR